MEAGVGLYGRRKGGCDVSDLSGFWRAIDRTVLHEKGNVQLQNVNIRQISW